MAPVTNLFQWLLDRVMAWWPVRLVDADEQGVKFTGGKKLTLLEPGVHWFFPKWETIEKVNVKYQEVDCLTQALETTDGVGILISVNVGYDIRNAVKWRTEVQEFDDTLERRVRGLVAQSILPMSWEELRNAETVAALSQAVLTDLRDHGAKWGVRFRNVSVTDLARSRPLRVFTS